MQSTDSDSRVVRAPRTAAGATSATTQMPMALIVGASTASTSLEWYDFFIFGTLASIISKHFFAGVNESAAFIFALGVFGAGFAFRPLGALVFGRLGDKAGRKSAFILAISLMGIATVGIGILPTYAQIGLGAPALLILMRVIQGFALGGQYGAAAVYVAEHAPRNRRGTYTAWIQISAAFGLIGALGMILTTRSIMGEARFALWGWRIPFLFSSVLLIASLWMRARLGESPVFKKMQLTGAISHAPFTEAFCQWRHLKLVLIALFGIMVAQGAVWYSVFFYSQFFLEKILKVNAATVNLLMIAITLISAPLYVLFGWLSDQYGRKIIMLSGMILATAAFVPGFHIIARAANPALIAATESSPVVVVAPAATCSFQWDPVGKADYDSACDIAKSALANLGVSYANENAAAAAASYVRIGGAVVPLQSAQTLLTAQSKAAVKARVTREIKSALLAAGYPGSADPAHVSWAVILAVMCLFVVGATALYGPIAATLVELFPTRIRYTAMSLPYNIGTGWVGGFLPFTAFAMVAANGNMYFGLWYPVAATALSIVVTLLFLPETRGTDITAA